jgi:hypothetical protein
VEEYYYPLYRHQSERICICGAHAKQIITAPILVAAQPECRYDSPVTGEPITTWAQRQEDLKRNNCRPYDPEMKTDNERRAADQERALDRSIDEHVEATIEKMPTTQRGKLYSELTEQGVDVHYHRTTLE